MFVAAGAVCLMFSGTTLAFTQFDRAFAPLVVMLTYLFAQAMIAAG